MQHINRTWHYKPGLNQHYQCREGYGSDTDCDNNQPKVMDTCITPEPSIQAEQPEAKRIERNDPAHGDPHDRQKFRLDIEIEAKPEGRQPSNAGRDNVVCESEGGTRVGRQQTVNHSPSQGIFSNAGLSSTLPIAMPAQALRRARLARQGIAE